jgi:hypothetical protein
MLPWTHCGGLFHKEEAMCQKCLDAARRHFPDKTDEQRAGILIGATCFPFGSPEETDKQLAELAARIERGPAVLVEMEG